MGHIFRQDTHRRIVALCLMAADWNKLTTNKIWFKTKLIDDKLLANVGKLSFQLKSVFIFAHYVKRMVRRGRFTAIAWDCIISISILRKS